MPGEVLQHFTRTRILNKPMNMQLLGDARRTRAANVAAVVVASVANVVKAVVISAANVVKAVVVMVASASVVKPWSAS